MRPIIALLVAVLAAGLLPSAPVHADCMGLESLASIIVGTGPREIVADSARQRVYVANSGDNTVSVIDARSSSVIVTWPLAGPIRAMALNPTTGALYLAYAIEQGRTELWIVETESGQHVRGLWFDWSIESLAVNPSLQRVYLAGRWTSPNAISFEQKSMVDGDVTEELHAGGSSGGLTWYSGIAVDEATGTVYAAHHYKYNEQSYIEAFNQDLRGGAGGIQFGESHNSPQGIVIDSVRRRALIIMGGIRIVDIGAEPRWHSNRSDPPLEFTGAQISSHGSLAVSIDETTGVAFAAPLNTYVEKPFVLSAFDVMTGQEIGQATLAGSMSHQLAVDSATHRVYVTNENDGTVGVFRGFASLDVPAC